MASSFTSSEELYHMLTSLDGLGRGRHGQEDPGHEFIKMVLAK